MEDSDPVLGAALGLAGVLLGLMLGSGYTFWATYRAELAAALAAVAALAQDLRWVSDRPASAPTGTAALAPGASTGGGPVADGARNERIDAAWRRHQGALVQIMRPADFRRLAERIQAERTSPQPTPGCPDLVIRLTGVHEILWEAHERFIVRSLVRMLGPRRVTEQIRAALDPSAPA